MTTPGSAGKPDDLGDLIRRLRRGPEAQQFRYLDDPVGLVRKLRAEAERRDREGVPMPEVPPPDSSVARRPPRTPDILGDGRDCPRRRVALRYGLSATAAATLLAIAGAVGYLLRGESGPETVRPPKPPSPTPLVRATIECRFDLWREGAVEPEHSGILGESPVDARRGDTLIIHASASNPTLWAFFARTPGGTIFRVNAMDYEATVRPKKEALFILPIESDGELLVAAVATPDEGGYREVIRAFGADAEFRRPLGANRELAYANGSTSEFEVRGAPPSVASTTARTRFEQLCRRLAEHSGGEARAIATPVAPKP
jgi:hypothetical protein